MTTHTTYFSSDRVLKEFINTHKITDSKSLMIQVLTSMTNKKEIQKLLEIINLHFPLSQLIGSTTHNDANHDTQSTHTTMISFTLFNTTRLSTYIINDFEDFYSEGHDLALNQIQYDTKVILAYIHGPQHCDLKFQNGINFVNTKVKVLLHREDSKLHQGYIFTKELIYSHAFVAIFMHSTHLQVATQKHNNWKPIGNLMTITKASSNRIYSINNTLASTLYNHYLGLDLSLHLPHAGVEFPLIIIRNTTHIICAILSQDNDGSLLVSEAIQEGDKVSFSYSDCASIHNNTSKRIESLFMSDFISHSKAAFFHYAKLPSVDSHKLAHEKGSLLILSEKNAITFELDEQKIITVLSHLIQVTSKEYLEIENKYQPQKKNKSIKRRDDSRSLTYTTNKERALLKEKISLLSGTQILLAEDSTTNQKIILGILKDSGIHVDIANNGEEVIDSLQDKHYDLILMDVQMPVLDGIEATIQIRKMNKNIPIIALTASTEIENIQQTQSAGMNEHLIKPINIDLLYKTLLKYMNQKMNTYDNDTIDKDISTFNLVHLNTQLGLKHLGNDTVLYVKILNDFYIRYKNLNLEFLADSEYSRMVHTIKGLSANIGATALYSCIVQLETSYDESSTSQFYRELTSVLDDIQSLLKTQKNEVALKNLNVSKNNIQSLFQALKSAIEKERPKLCEPIISKLSQCHLSQNEEKLLNIIKNTIDEFDFDEALLRISKNY